MRPFFASLALFAALAFTSPSVAQADGPHCWCRVHKSDCGDCNTSCLLHDYGAVAEFRTLQLHKDDLCKEACSAKLAAMTEPGICTDLNTTISVPLPWGGEVHSCWNVGAGTFRKNAARTVSCAAPPPPDGPVYPPPGAPYWKTTQFDDFKGKPADASPEVASCYDRPASCMAYYLEGPTPCDPASQAGLAHLDKCAWTVLHKSNWMSIDTAAADPRQVRVDPNRENGVLVLSARAVKPDGSYAATGPTHVKDGQTLADDALVKRSKWEAGYDCASVPDPWNGHPLRYKCPFVEGQVVSKPSVDGAPGFSQKYGRFSVRMRIPYGAGSFPAAWMLPDNGSWPGAGELDVFESTPQATHVWQTLHAGNCLPGNGADLDPDACVANGGSRWHLVGDSDRIYPKDVPDHTPFWQGFHVVSVEWDETSLRFSTDGIETRQLKELDLVRGTKSGVAHHWWNKGTWEKWLPVHIPDRPFHWIINIALHEQDGKYPNPKNFVPQEMLVDWVKAEQVCRTKLDFCPNGGDLDVATNRCLHDTGGTRPVTYDSPCHR